MKVILLKDVAGLGKRYDIKEVSNGHALNMLIPQGLVIAATKETIKKSEQERIRAKQEKKVQEDLLIKNINDLNGLVLQISSKANEKGHLFAGINKEVIATELSKKTGLQIDPAFIELDQHIKTIGEHTIKVNGVGKMASFKLEVIGEK